MNKRRMGEYKLGSRDKLMVEDLLKIIECAINEQVVGLVTLDSNGAVHVALACDPDSFVAEVLAKAAAVVAAEITQEQKP